MSNTDFENDYRIAYTARKGIRAEVFYEIAKKMGLPNQRLAAMIHISTKTINSYRDKKKSLDPVHSEHLLKLMALYKKGEQVFRTVEEFNYWLRKPFWNSDERPMDWLVTPGGVDLVKKELLRIEHGYPV